MFGRKKSSDDDDDFEKAYRYSIIPGLAKTQDEESDPGIDDVIEESEVDDVVFCRNCGNAVMESHNFSHECGSRQ